MSLMQIMNFKMAEEKLFTCTSCNHELPESFQMRTPGYCYLCDPHVTVEELLKEEPIPSTPERGKDYHTEDIQCPECGKVQEALVVHTVPWYTYYHECKYCKYDIGESEWIVINEVPTIKPHPAIIHINGNLNDEQMIVINEMVEKVHKMPTKKLKRLINPKRKE